MSCAFYPLKRYPKTGILTETGKKPSVAQFFTPSEAKADAEKRKRKAA